MTEQGALYDGFVPEYYDHSPILTERTEDIAFYCNAAKQYGDPVLELGCGTGRITLAIAEAGYRVVGLDISGKMLERAAAFAGARRKKAEKKKLVVGQSGSGERGQQSRSSGNRNHGNLVTDRE